MTHEKYDYLEAAKFILAASRREARREAKAKGAAGGDSFFTVDQLINVGAVEVLIAIAERRPQFVQVGNQAIRLDRIEGIVFKTNAVLIYGTSQEDAAYVFKDEDRASFLAWWNEYADVVRLPQVPDAPAE